MPFASSAFVALSRASASPAATSAASDAVAIALSRGFAASGAIAAAAASAVAVAGSVPAPSAPLSASPHLADAGRPSLALLASLLPVARCLEVSLRDHDAEKTYVIDVKSYLSTFSPGAVCFRAALNAGVSYHKVVTRWLEEAAAIEAEARERPDGLPDRPLPKFEWEAPAWASLGLFIRESCVVTARRAYEKLAVRRLAPRLAAKLLKHPPLSARRKCLRASWEHGLGRLEKAASMARTCAMATVTRVLAELTVATAISTVACRKLYQLRKSGALPPPEPRPGRGGASGGRRGDGDGEGDDRVRVSVSVEREVATLYFRLLGGHVVKGACLMMGGALGAAAVAATRWEDSPVAARRLTFLGVAAGEAVGAWCATNIVAATFG